METIAFFIIFVYYKYINTYIMSFTLRTIDSDQLQNNTFLGESYQVIHREYNNEEFAKMFNAVYGRIHVADDDPTSDKNTKRVYAFIIYDGGKSIPLFKSRSAFIMSDSGKTFDNLSFR